MTLAERYGVGATRRADERGSSTTRNRSSAREIASWPDGTRDVRRLPRLGRHRRRATCRIEVEIAIDGDEVTVDFSRLGADGARSAQRHALVHEATVYQAVMSAVSARDPDHVRRVPAGHCRDEARHGRTRRDARRFVDARRHRLPHVRRGQRGARPADPAPRAGRRRGRQHARDLRRHCPRRRARSSTTSSSSARGVRVRPPTATTASPTRARRRRTSPSRWPSRSSRS